jgi:uncharacterized membrane protein YphA (DoxX/SURF4 family)
MQSDRAREVAMRVEAAIGRPLLAVGVIALGAQCVVFSKFVLGLEPVSAGIAPAVPWAWVSGVFLIGAGLGLLVTRSARIAAVLLAGFFLTSTILLHGPLLVAHLKDDADDAFHTLAIGAAALVLAAEVGRPAGNDRSSVGVIERAGSLGRLCFGVCTVGHGVMHFVFFKFTADFVPAWIPWHAFWAAATGIAQIAAGLAILSGVQARLAATLTGVMYGSWVLIVHIPRVLAQPESRVEWTSVAIAATLSASALVVAGALAEPRAGASGAD